MATSRRASAGRKRPPEIVFVSTFAVVALFALYSFGRSYTSEHVNQGKLVFARESEPQDVEVGSTFHIARRAFC